MARRTLTFAAGAGRHALPAAQLQHVAAASEPPVAVAWADTAPARAMAACSMSPASRSTRVVINTRSIKPLPNPNASGSRYPAGLWPTAGGRAAANSGRHTGVEPGPLAHRRSLPDAEVCACQPTSGARASQNQFALLRTVRSSLLLSHGPVFARPCVPTTSPRSGQQ
jgi:hypothetical protein